MCKFVTLPNTNLEYFIFHMRESFLSRIFREIVRIRFHKIALFSENLSRMSIDGEFLRSVEVKTDELLGNSLNALVSIASGKVIGMIDKVDFS